MGLKAFTNRWNLVRDWAQSGYVYFIETADAQYIKIGFSQNPKARLYQLGTSRPSTLSLRLLASFPGTRDTERRLHLKFAEDWDKGEWFRGSHKLRAFIARLAQENPSQVNEILQQAALREETSETVIVPLEVYVTCKYDLEKFGFAIESGGLWAPYSEDLVHWLKVKSIPYETSLLGQGSKNGS